MLGTGSPIPLWHIERLHGAVEVKAIGDEALELKDGSTVRLPFIKRLPRTDPLLAKAVSRGVEVGQGGVVYGLVEPTRMCGNDPVVYYRVRVNLSELVGVVYPDGIDETIVHPDRIKDFKENNFQPTARTGRNAAWFLGVRGPCAAS